MDIALLAIISLALLFILYGFARNRDLFYFQESINKNLHMFRDSFDKFRVEINNSLQELTKENNIHLDRIRNVVDEKLQGTLEKRLGESFKLVTERLEVMHKGLGEMQSLAEGVGDLKKVLGNVKTRGTWGEVQLKSILTQILSPTQFLENVNIKPSTNERVEFAIRLPGNGEEVLLPIDSKFPLDDIENLGSRIRAEAKAIYNKYVDPPKTTDFAILFLPTENLYAKVLQEPNLFEDLQNNCRVIVAGPWTLAAILNSLQLGFKTLAIQKRSSEVWQILGGIRLEFVKFADLLDKTHKKIIEAGDVLESASKKSRTIERKLEKVENIEENFLIE